MVCGQKLSSDHLFVYPGQGQPVIHIQGKTTIHSRNEQVTRLSRNCLPVSHCCREFSHRRSVLELCTDGWVRGAVKLAIDAYHLANCTALGQKAEQVPTENRRKCDKEFRSPRAGPDVKEDNCWKDDQLKAHGSVSRSNADSDARIRPLQR